MNIEKNNKSTKDLKETEKKFMELFYSSNDAFLIMEDERFIDCNDAAVQMLQAGTKEKILSRHPSEISPEYQPDGSLSTEKANEMIELAKQKGVNRFEWIHRRYGGEDFPAEVSLMLIPLGGKHVIYVILKDITDNKISDERIRKSEETAQAFIKAITDIATLIGIDGTILMHNEALAESLGYPGQSLIGRNLFDYFSDEVTKRRKQVFERVIDTGRPNVFEDEREDRYYRTSLYPVYGKDMQVESLAMHSMDITEKKETREELDKYKEHLERLVDERTKKLSKTNKKLSEKNAQITQQKEKLEQLNKELNEANAAKDKFFSIIAHDLKDPLSSLRNVTNLLAGSFADFRMEEIQEYIVEINKSTKYVYQLIENLLDWSRAQTGRTKFNPDTADLFQIVENNIFLLKMHAEKKNINLESNISRFTNIYVDVNMISTVLRNLITNAIKFTYEGGKIKVTSKKKGDVIEVSVKDNGIGMNKEEQKKLFRIDVQHSTEGTKQEKGTGLGLILCKEFISKHQFYKGAGEIWLISEKAKGSDFRFTLPIPEKVVKEEDND